MHNRKKQQPEGEYQGLSIVAAIRLDQAHRGLRGVSQKSIRNLEAQAEQLDREVPFTVLAGIER